MAGNGIRAKLPIAAIILLSGSVLAAGPDAKVPVVDPSPEALRLEAGISPETQSIRISSLHLSRPLQHRDTPVKFTRKLFQTLSNHLEEQSHREELQNTQAFLSSAWSNDDSYMEEFRSQRAEALLSRAVDDYLDDQLDHLLVEVRFLNQMATFLDRASDWQINNLWQRDRQAPATTASAPDPILRPRAEGKVKLHVGFHPRLRLEGSWGRFTGKLDLPLAGDTVRLRILKEFVPGFSAQLDSVYPLGGDAYLTTVGFSVIF